MARRDKRQFSEFALARSPALQRAAFLIVGDEQLAQDLVQEALVKTYVHWHRLRDPNSAEAYARRAMTTTAIDWFRRKSWNAERVVERMPDTGVDGPEDQATERDSTWQALQALPPRQRAALVLRYYEDLSEADTAAALGCSPGTVKSQVSAGLAKLRAAAPPDPRETVPTTPGTELSR